MTFHLKSVNLLRVSFVSSPGVKIITQQVQPSKILPKPSSVALSSSSSSPIMVVSSNGAIMTTKLVTQPTGECWELEDDFS